MKKILCLALLCCAMVCRAGDISPLLVPVDFSKEPGTDVQFWLVYLNTGSTSAQVHVPAALPITLGPLPLQVHQKLVREDKTSVLTIAPGEFKRILFETRMPPNVTGPVTFEIDQLSRRGAPVVVVAAAPPAVEESPAVARAPVSDPHTSPTTQAAPAVVANSSSPRSAPHVTEPLEPKPHEWFEDPMAESFAGRFSTYQPMYLIAGSRPTAKIQLSLKYKIFDDQGAWAEKYSFLDHIYLAYTQTSFWDVAAPDPKFTDNSYKPELMFSYDDILPRDATLLDLSQLGLQGGFEHESNGTGGTRERSMNIVYLRPIFIWDIDKANGWFVSVAPRAYVYVTTGEYDHDISLYRGYGDVRLVFGQSYGPQVAFFARVGEDFNRGSLEVDFSQPLRGRSAGNLDLYFYAQFFTGYGEQLGEYNKSTTTWRLGLAFVR